jgi:hypothetical protein
MQSVLFQLGHIAFFIVLPVLLMIALGFLLQRTLSLDMRTLTRLNFYVVVPAMVYFAVVESAVAPGDVFTVVGFSLLLMIVWGAVAYAVALARGVPSDQRRAMLMTSLFYNAGNYGLPLQELAFRSAGLSSLAMSLQVFVLIVQNITGFTLGVVLAAGRLDQGRWKRNLAHIIRFPPLYALIAAVLTIALRQWLGQRAEFFATALRPAWDVVLYAKSGFVVIALVTVGAQLALVQRTRLRYPVTTSVILRLLVGPAIALGLLKLLGLTGFVAQVLLISTATPTSVTCLLLCLEFNNHPDYVARTVFFTTILSPISVTIVILLAQSGLI